MDEQIPHTVASLTADLTRLGVAPGDVVLLHSSNRSLGFVAGGAQAFVQALLDTLGPGGTLVVPTHTSDNCDPAGWQHPPVPEAWWPVIREQAPGFDKLRSPSRWLGVIPELVRTWPGALRSDHPRLSFAAIGAEADAVTRDHRLDDGLGEHSPLGAVYRLDGKILLLGCGHDTNTSLHLAEWRQPSSPRGEQGASIRRPDGTSHWVTFTDVLEDESDFAALGEAFEQQRSPASPVTVGRVGDATARLMSQRAAVDFATGWIAANRPTAGAPIRPTR
jgi:aminoglycoside 3-N-acetyltransferase